MSTIHKRRRETVYLYQGDDLDHLTELGRKVAEAQASEAAVPAGSRLLSDTGAQDAKEAFNAFRDEAQERATKVVVEALGRVAWRDLTREHPPREQTITDDEGKPTTVLHDDDGSGVNFDTFPDALVPASIVEPEFASDDERAGFVDDLSDPDFYRLYGTAWMLNRSPADPKALPVYDVIPESDAT
jgi:hypothetical protein